MYYTGLDPRTMEPVYIPSSPHEKAMQRALIQYRNPDNYDLVKEALIKAERTDLIGLDKNCLIGPRKGLRPGNLSKNNKNSNSNQASLKNTNNHRQRANNRTADNKNNDKSVNKKKKTIRNIHKKK